MIYRGLGAALLDAPKTTLTPSTVFPTGGGTITTGGGFVPKPGSIPGYVTDNVMFGAPPAACVLAFARTKAEGTAKPAGVIAEMTITPEQAQAVLWPADWAKLAAARVEWKRKYPSPDVPAAPIVYGVVRGTSGQALSHVYVVRPATTYDPMLYEQPPLRPGDPNEVLLEAGLRLFMPDYVLGSMGDLLRRGEKTGSMTPDGPFPYWVPLVTEDMVKFAVEYVKTTPDAFAQPGKGGGGSHILGIPGPIGGAMDRALQFGASTGNPYAAAVAAVGSLIVDGFSALFGFGSDPEPPAWLTKLLRMKVLRGDKSPDGPRTFGSSRAGASGFVKNRVICPRAFIYPPAGASYTVGDGYKEVIKRLSKTGSALPWWLMAGLAAATVYAAT